jgi:hypothetical protein
LMRRDAPVSVVAQPERLGGTDGNEILTVSTAALLTVLLMAEGVTVVRMRGLVTVVFGVHFLAYAPHVARALPDGGRATRRPRGAGLRGGLIAAAGGGGVALAVALLPTITKWQP